MNKKMLFLLSLVLILFTVCGTSKVSAKKAETPELKALIINGQNNHNWKIGSDAMEKILEGSELFIVEVATSPEKGEDMSNFNPDFSTYDLVVMDFNGDEWCDETKTNFVNYVKNGGGLFILHAADNSFSKWKEYNQMIGLGGWGGRNEESGPYVYYKDGKILRSKDFNEEGYLVSTYGY